LHLRSLIIKKQKQLKENDENLKENVEFLDASISNGGIVKVKLSDKTCYVWSSDLQSWQQTVSLVEKQKEQIQQVNMLDADSLADLIGQLESAFSLPSRPSQKSLEDFESSLEIF